MGLITNIAARMRTALTGTADHGTPRSDAELDCSLRLEDGTGANQANKCWHDQRTLGASASENLDLAGGLNDAFGGAITFTAIKAILIKAAAGNVNNVVIGAAASNAFVGPFGASTHTLHLAPGASVLLLHPGAGWPVTAGTGDILKIANGGAGTSVTYDIALAGVG
jgi:hypothetical protein